MFNLTSKQSGKGMLKQRDLIRLAKNLPFGNTMYENDEVKREFSNPAGGHANSCQHLRAISFLGIFLGETLYMSQQIRSFYHIIIHNNKKMDTA